MFSFYNKHNNDLYNNLVKLSRNLFFYNNLLLKDNFETRIMLMFIHFSIIIQALKKRKEKLPQDIYDNFFLNVEYHLRELGFGDIAVNKKMKTLNKIFYDILLKINLKDSKNDLINDKVIKLYLYNDSSINEQIITKSIDYFDKFKSFCYENDLNSIIRYEIN